MKARTLAVISSIVLCSAIITSALAQSPSEPARTGAARSNDTTRDRRSKPKNHSQDKGRVRVPTQTDDLSEHQGLSARTRETGSLSAISRTVGEQEYDAATGFFSVSPGALDMPSTDHGFEWAEVTEYRIALTVAEEQQTTAMKMLGLELSEDGTVARVSASALERLNAAGVTYQILGGVTHYVVHRVSDPFGAQEIDPGNLKASRASPIHETLSTGVIELGSGTVDMYIKDNTGSGQYYRLRKQEAPSGSWVTNLEYRTRIEDEGDGNFYCADYEVWLFSGDVAWETLVYDNLGGATDGGYDDDSADDYDIYLNWRNTHYFDGEDPNQWWGVICYDNWSGDDGQMNYIEFKVHWESAPFEPYFYNARITNRIDQDGDGYARQFDIEFDVDSDVGGYYYVEVYEDDPWPNPDDYLGTSNTYWVEGYAADYHPFTVVCDNHNLYHGTAEFVLKLYDASDNSLVETWDQGNDGDLGNVQVELSSEDQANPPGPPGTPNLAAADDTGHSSSDNITYQTTSLTFSWSAASGTVDRYYHGWDDSAPTSNWTSSLSTDVSAPSGNGNHTFYVRGWNSIAGYGPASSLTVFIDRNHPSITNLDLRASDDAGKYNNDNLTNDTNVRFTWTGNANGGSGIYRYWYGWDSNANDGSTSNTYKDISPPSNNGTYTFYVGAEAESGLWAYYPTYTDQETVTWDTIALAPPTFVSPGEGVTVATGSPRLDWQGVSGAWKYRAYVREHAIIPIDSRESPELTGSYWDVTPELANKAWGWQVKVWDIAGNEGAYGRNGATGTWGHFTVAVPLPTRFRGNHFVDKTAKIGIPILLEAKLERDNPPWYNDIEGNTVHFDIYYSGSWHEVDDDGISSTSFVTDGNGIASVYYTAPTSRAPGDYQMRARFDGDSDYASCSLTRTLSVKKPNWLVMIYVCADNDLEEASVEDFYDEMWQARGNDEVSICVLYDRSPLDDSTPGYSDDQPFGEPDWWTARYFRFCENVLIYNEWGELNLGSQSVLQSFVDTALSQCSADHIGLILWNHGSGWKRERPLAEPLAPDLIRTLKQDAPVRTTFILQHEDMQETAQDEQLKGVCWDDTGDHLLLSEVRGVFDSITNGGTSPIDVLGYDACLMGMLEVAYDAALYARYFVASEDNETWDGWEYHRILGTSAIDSSTTARQWGQKIVDESIQPTLGCWDLSHADARFNEMASFAQRLFDIVEDARDDADGARDASHKFPSSTECYVDLRQFTAEIASRSSDSILSSRGQAVANGLADPAWRVAWKSTHTDASTLGGLSIYYPGSRFDGGYDNYFTMGYLLFTSHPAQKWDEALRSLLEWRVLGVDSAGGVGSVSITCDEDEMGNGAGATPLRRFYEINDTVNISAPEIVGSYIFVRWQLDGSNQPSGQLSLSVAMNDDHDAVAVYQVQTHTLDVSSSPEINVPIDVSPNPDDTTPFQRTYNHGANVSLTAPQTHSGYNFVRWRLDGSNQPSGQRTVNVTMNDDHNAAAVYQVQTHTLDVSSSPEINVPIDVNPNPDGTTPFQQTYNHGTNVSLTAPQTHGGYSFVRWRLDSSDQPAGQLSLSVTMNDDHDAVAVYETMDCTLSVSSDPEINVPIDANPDPDGVTPFERTYPCMTSASLTAPETYNCYSFVHWRLDGADQPSGQRTLNITMDGDREAVAVYQQMTAPEISSWEIAATHGASEIYFVIQDGYVEPREVGINKLRVCFDQAMDTSVTDPGVVAIAGNVNGDQSNLVQGISWADDTCMVITLSSPLPDEDTYTVTISTDVRSADGCPLAGDRDISISALIGDVNGDCMVNVGDVLPIRNHRGQAVEDETTARCDVNCDGAINVGDVLIVKNHRGSACP